MTQITQRELPRAVERSVNEEMQAQFVRHQVYLQQLGTSEAVKIQALLSDLEGDVAKQLSKRFDAIQARGFDRGVNTTRRMQSMFVSFRQLNDQAIKTIQDQTAETLTELAVDEQDFVADTLKNTLPVRYDTRLVSPQYLRTIATKPLIEGTPLNTWWGKLADDTQIRLESAVRLSSAEGETVEQAIRRIRGTTQGGVFVDGALTGTRREAEALARTALNGTANQARMAVLEENDDLLKGYQWVATLDSRICLQCAGLDGKNYESMEGRIQPPAHVNCRCTLVPVLKSEEELDLPPVKGIKSTRASMNGQVPASQTYGRWLKDQPVSVQEDVLGKTKAKLFRDGKLKIGSFTNRKGKTLTLDELKVKEGRKKPKVDKPETPVDKINKANEESARKAKIVADTNAPIEKRIEAWEEGDLLVAQAQAIVTKNQKQIQGSQGLQELSELREHIRQLNIRKQKLTDDFESTSFAITKDRKKEILKEYNELMDNEIPKATKALKELESKLNVSDTLQNVREEFLELVAVRTKAQATANAMPTNGSMYQKGRGRLAKEKLAHASKNPINNDTKMILTAEEKKLLSEVKDGEGMVGIQSLKIPNAPRQGAWNQERLYWNRKGSVDSNGKPWIDANVTNEGQAMDIQIKVANSATEFVNRITKNKTDANVRVNFKNPKKTRYGYETHRAHYDDDTFELNMPVDRTAPEKTWVHEIGHAIEHERKLRGNTSSFQFHKYRTEGIDDIQLKKKYSQYGQYEYGNGDKYDNILKKREELGLSGNQASRKEYFGKRYYEGDLYKNVGHPQYVGTVYKKKWQIAEYNATEVISILLEDLNQMGAEMAVADPEAFKFIIGYLRGVF
tara:strand:- start:1036 stop:3588 length:2553 start_codon:yes stop_codon:yes gene_type:complete